MGKRVQKFVGKNNEDDDTNDFNDTLVLGQPGLTRPGQVCIGCFKNNEVLFPFTTI